MQTYAQKQMTLSGRTIKRGGYVAFLSSSEARISWLWSRKYDMTPFECSAMCKIKHDLWEAAMCLKTSSLPESVKKEEKRSAPRNLQLVRTTIMDASRV